MKGERRREEMWDTPLKDVMLCTAREEESLSITEKAISFSF